MPPVLFPILPMILTKTYKKTITTAVPEICFNLLFSFGIREYAISPKPPNGSNKRKMPPKIFFASALNEACAKVKPDRDIPKKEIQGRKKPPSSAIPANKLSKRSFFIFFL